MSSSPTTSQALVRIQKDQERNRIEQETILQTTQAELVRKASQKEALRLTEEERQSRLQMVKKNIYQSEIERKFQTNAAIKMADSERSRRVNESKLLKEEEMRLRQCSLLMARKMEDDEKTRREKSCSAARLGKDELERKRNLQVAIVKKVNGASQVLGGGSGVSDQKLRDVLGGFRSGDHGLSGTI